MNMQKNRGAALLEVIVAIGIVTMVMTTIVSLVSVSLKSASFAQSKTLGTKYSQEGMEALRQMRTIQGWDSFVATLQADGTTIHYCLPTIPRSAAEFAALTNASCTATQFVDAKGIFQREATITLTTNAGTTSVAINVKTTWYDGSIQKSSGINQQFQEYTVQDAPVPVQYSPVPYIPYGYSAGVWKYKEPIPVTNTSGAAQTDFQVMATLNTASLVSASKMLANCADLRITTSDSKTNIPFWIEPTTCNTATTKIWIKVPSIPIAGTTLYAIYGNSSAVDAGYYTTDVFVRAIPSLGAAWNMNETSWSGVSGEVKDSSGNNNNGVSAGATITTGKFGNGGLFSGAVGPPVVTNYIGVADSPTVGPTAQISVSAWLKTTGANVNAVILGKSAGCASTGYLVWLNENAVGAGLPGYYTNPGGWLNSNASIHNGAWHHLVTTFNSATVNIYVDGVLKATGARTATSLDNANILQIGGATAAGGGCVSWFNGTLDDVTIYDRAISAAEVSDIYGTGGDRQVYSTPNYVGVGLDRKWAVGVSAGTAGSEVTGTFVFTAQDPGTTSPIAYYKFATNYAGAAIDSSGNNLTGTYVGTGTHFVSTGLEHNAGTFNGAGDGVSLGTPAELDFGDNGPFTFDGWIKPTALVDYGGFVSKITPGRLSPYAYMTVTMADGRLAAYNGSAWITLCPAGSVQRARWSHIAFSYNGTSLNGFVNGNNCGSVNFSYTDNSTYAVWIGSWYSPVTNYDFNGTMDEVKIYDKALTTADIQADYQAGASTLLNPIVNLAFNDGTGTTITDSSANGLDGTWGGTGSHWVGASPNYAGKLNGAGDYLTLGSNALFNLGTGEPFSWEAWIKPTVMKDYANIISKQAPSRTSPYSYLIAVMANGRLSGYTGAAWVDICPAGSISVGTWQHVAYTFNGGGVIGYVNGVSCGAATWNYTDYTAHAVSMGSHYAVSSIYDYNGLMDQITMYDYFRSASEIAADYAAYTPPSSVNWSYRVPIAVTNTYTSTLTNYQVMIKMNTAALVTAGKMNQDCSDLRITASNGTTALPFWVETGTNGCNTTTTTIWVKVPSMPVGSTSLLAYYGNGLASDISDGKQVFDFFDDFSGTTLDTTKWASSAGAAGYTVSNGLLTVLSGAIYSKAPVAPTVKDESFEMRAAWGAVYVYYSGLTLSETSLVAGNNGGGSAMAMIQSVGATQTVDSWASDGVAVGYNLQNANAFSTPVALTYYYSGISYTPTNLWFYNERIPWSQASTTVWYPPYLSLGFFFGSGAAAQDITNLFVDFVDARKLVSPAPAAVVSAEVTGTWTGL